MISTWSLNHLAGKLRPELIKMRKIKGDKTVEELLYYFVQYFERKSLSSSRCFNLWLISLMEWVRCHQRRGDQRGNVLICRCLSTAWSVVFVEAIFVVVSPIHHLISSVEQIRWILRVKLKEVARLVCKRWHKE